MNFTVFSQLMMIRARSPEPEPDVLPDAYTAIDYIICTGAQYLDTGLKAKATGKYQVKAQHTNNTKVNALLGDGNSKTDSNLGLWMNGGVSGTGYGTQAVFGNGNNSGYFINEAKGSYPARQLRTYELDVASHTYTIDGVVEGTTTSVGAFANSKKLVLGACWRSNAIVSGSMFTGNIHFFKAWEGSTLVCNMVPCIKKDGNVPGMYDFVTKAFFGSATSTPFEAPASGLDEETAEQVSLAYGNGVWLGDVPATEEEAVHQALLEE